MPIASETEAYAYLLGSHMRAMSRRLRRMPDEQWDWTPDVAAPTGRQLIEHAYACLVCDRYHIDEYNALLHPRVPDLPKDREAMCLALDEEVERWKAMLAALTPEQLAEDRKQFDMSPWTVRGVIAHSLQNSIYKNGQLSTLYFALGLDGTAPYDVPSANPIYDALHRGEAVRAERAGETVENFRATFIGENIPAAVIDAAYELLSAECARHIPVRASDTLLSLFLLSQPENILNMYGGVPVRWLAKELAQRANMTPLPDDWDIAGVETVGDLVRRVVRSIA